MKLPKKLKNKQLIVGHSVNTEMPKKIVNGELVFYLMDTQGIPFDMIVDEYKERGFGFDVHAFIKAAIESKNYTKETIYTFFKNRQVSDDVLIKVRACLGFDEVISNRQ